MKTFALSLATEAQRRQHILSECTQYKLNVEIIDAIDMRQATESEIHRLSNKLTHLKPKKQRYLSKGELGCALSHHAVYQRIVDEHEDFALILEDDARFLTDPCPLFNLSSLKTIMAQYPFDIIVIGYVKTLENQLPYYYRRIALKKRAQLQTENTQYIFGTPWEQYACGTVAYIISQEGARKLLDITAQPSATADDWLYFEEKVGLRILHARPTLVLEDLEHLDSTIRQENANFLQPKRTSIIIRSIKGCLKNIGMNYLGLK